jgi:ElaB/YqjD/DUF883 family membrane-anchored ribosome-binding protein
MQQNLDDVADDAKTQIAQLRRQVEALMTDHVTPTLANAASCAENAARSSIDYTKNRAEAASSRIREQPLVAVGVALGAGYLIGRLLRA